MKNPTDKIQPRNETKLPVEPESTARPAQAYDSDSIYEIPYSIPVNGPRKESITRSAPAHDSESIYEIPYSTNVNGPRKAPVKGRRKAVRKSSNDKSTHIIWVSGLVIFLVTGLMKYLFGKLNGS